MRLPDVPWLPKLPPLPRRPGNHPPTVIPSEVEGSRRAPPGRTCAATHARPVPPDTARRCPRPHGGARRGDLPGPHRHGRRPRQAILLLLGPWLSDMLRRARRGRNVTTWTHSDSTPSPAASAIVSAAAGCWPPLAAASAWTPSARCDPGRRRAPTAATATRSATTAPTASGAPAAPCSACFRGWCYECGDEQGICN